ncbi:restriction endonuclease [Paenibacillus eucommiae]|uniref:Restriction endonuclease type IV Mrr domain-containing protein n=1 Tax=Paenibacillus eucommiae TaxID=1355755 RepID=A0ABS4IY84_9BACL|nr:restriction endonuclease [Paenibacillus eucommiae]MBP1992537.1 hypothetical protein [Paenibacillus eucommiae]
MSRKGDVFEKAVASIQSKIDPNSKVTHDEKIVDKYGHFRQFDVVIRGKLGGRNLLGVIECKDWKAKVDLPVIDAFLTKMRGVNAHFGIIASNSGFTKSSLEKCKMEQIGAISLIPNENTGVGFAIKMSVCAREYSWTNMYAEMSGTGYVVIDRNTTIEEMFVKGKEDFSLADWFRYHLDNEYEHDDYVGDYRKEITFVKPQLIIAKGYEFPVSKFVFCASRIVKYKHRYINVNGDGMYEWNDDCLLIPPGGEVLFGPFTNDPSDWEEYEGEELKREGFDFIVAAIVRLYYDEKVPFDISKL